VTARGELYDLMCRGAWVTVTNPRVHSEWTGRLIALHDHPGVIIERADGVRMCLPQEFDVTEAPAPAGVVSRYDAGRADGLRQLAADLEDEAANIAHVLAEEPFAMSVVEARARVDAPTAERMLRKAAQLARDRAESPSAPLNVPGVALASHRTSHAGNGNYSTEETA
jgi:hypothetical protein